ncbi:unnamed protein product [Rotaria magnacalcarata]
MEPMVCPIDSHHDDEDLNNRERQFKQVQPPLSRKQQRSSSQPPNDNLPQQDTNTSFKHIQNQTHNRRTSVSSETLLLSSFEVVGCTGKVQGSISLSQRLRALPSTKRHHNTTKYDGSLIVQIGSTSLSLKETLSTSTDNVPTMNPIERTTTKKRLGTRRKNTLSSNINAHPLEAEQSILSTSKRRNFEAHITAHCQGMTFSRTVLSTLKDQHKIGILFWLNYRNTYGHWNEQRRAFTTPTCDSTRLRSIVNVPTSPETTKELNIMFQLDGIQVSLEYEMRCEARIGSSRKIYNSEKS